MLYLCNIPFCGSFTWCKTYLYCFALWTKVTILRTETDPSQSHYITWLCGFLVAHNNIGSSSSLRWSRKSNSHSVTVEEAPSWPHCSLFGSADCSRLVCNSSEKSSPPPQLRCFRAVVMDWGVFNTSLTASSSSSVNFVCVCFVCVLQG